MSTVHEPSSRRGAGRWHVRLVLAILVLAQLFACQAVMAPVNGPSSVAIQDISHGLGHDVVCEAGAAPVASTTARAAASDCTLPAGAAVVFVALIAAGFVLAGRANAGGMPSWAPRRLVAGRHRLLAVGITRV